MPHTTEALIAYDGSEPSSAALRAAVALLPGANFTILVVHATPVTLDQAGAARAGLPDAVVREGIAGLEREILTECHARAEAGAALARDAGAVAQPATTAASGSVWREILKEAARRDSDVITCGTRGLGGLGRAALGSTSSALVHHADRPVLVLPA